MRSLGLVVVTLIAFSTTARAQDVDQPLFAAFKAFCADTDASPDAVKSAVEAAGGKAMGGVSRAAPGGYITSATWGITMGGRQLIISAGNSRNPYVPAVAGALISCQITSSADEDASASAIRKWVGIPPAPQSSPGLTFYSYQEEGSERKAITNKADSDRLDAEGRLWTLMVMERSVTLAHFVRTAPGTSN
jgi:hypothetical protein